MSKELLKVGVFGLWRGQSHLMAMNYIEGVRIEAICDQNPERVEEAKKYCPEDVKVFASYDELLGSGIDLVILCNYLPDHAKCAIQALRKGIAVVSECIPAATMKECVELVEAVEETGVYYSLAENSPYGTACLEMERIFGTGILGDLVYAEAEYCHPSSPKNSGRYSPTPDHWRRRLPTTYYLTHSLGPLMNMTRMMPKRVIGKTADNSGYVKARGGKGKADNGVMLVEMDSGALFRVTGCVSYGPQTHWFRLACSKGGVESVRTAEDTVCLAINPWDLPEESAHLGCVRYYRPEPDALSKEAISKGLPNVGHQVTDYRCVRNYIAEIREGRTPDMDVYRACAMSAVAILGWRSVLDDSRQYDIPDFRDKAAREQYRNDDLSPWRGEIPFCVHRVE